MCIIYYRKGNRSNYYIIYIGCMLYGLNINNGFKRLVRLFTHTVLLYSHVSRKSR